MENIEEKIVVPTESEKWVNNVAHLLAALSKHLSVSKDIEFDGLQKFTVAGLALGAAKEVQTLNDLLIDWGILKLQ